MLGLGHEFGLSLTTHSELLLATTSHKKSLFCPSFLHHHTHSPHPNLLLTKPLRLHPPFAIVTQSSSLSTTSTQHHHPISSPPRCAATHSHDHCHVESLLMSNLHHMSFPPCHTQLPAPTITIAQIPYSCATSTRA